MHIAFTKTTLPNGLDVILHEDHDLPIVAVNLWYHVGSKNERPGRTGFAHLFEHLMFEGSAHHNTGFFAPLQEAGASLNGSTNADRTNYWEVVPVNALELALWLESDRMGYLLPALSEEKFTTQRDVVLNERRQNYENRPYGMAGIALLSTLYPGNHPYGWPTIGWPSDLCAATLEDVRGFFERYYHPANASLTLAGDFDADEVMRLVERYFGEMAPGPHVDSVTPDAPPLPAREVRLVLEDRVELPRLYVAWRSPALFAEGDAAMDLVADALGSGKTSRLYRSLVHHGRLALDVSASQQSREIDGVFQVVATATAGHGLEPIDNVVVESLQSLADSGPTDAELERARAQAEAHFVYRLQTVGGFSGKSDQLNAYNVFLRDPGYFGEDLARYQRLTGPDVAAAARSLTVDSRVVLSVVPIGRRDLALPGSHPVEVS